MPADHAYHSILTVALLQRLPASIRESLAEDQDFLNSYHLQSGTTVTINEIGASFEAARLYDCIRQVLSDPAARPAVKDETGKEWRLELVIKDGEQCVVLSDESKRLILPDHSTLSQDQKVRLEVFDRSANEVNLPEKATSEWRNILASRPLTDDEIDSLHKELHDTPSQVANVIRSGLTMRRTSLSTLVPNSRRYFDRLIGKHQNCQDITDLAQTGLKEHIRQLTSWRHYEGFLQSLLLSFHPAVTSGVNVDQFEEEELIHIYKWLQKQGDLISRAGAIAIGLSILDKRPGIEPYLISIIEQMRDDDAGECSQFHLLSSLIALVDGELTRTKIFKGEPPFIRRLASIAHASLIQRCAIDIPINIANFSEWVWGVRGRWFYFQTMADLRQEPRWLPDYASPRQLKTELISQILIAAAQNKTKVHNARMQQLLFGEGPEGLQSQVQFPYRYLAGPLEGGLESQNEPPPEILMTIENQLKTDVLQPNSFVALVNSSFLFHLDTEQAALAAKALRDMKHQLRQAGSKDELVNLLTGLARVAAVTRSGDLAEELRTLTRRWRHEPGRGLRAEEAMRIALVAAAAHAELPEWCEFVGGWITELAFQSLESEEMVSMHSNLIRLCEVVPELWLTCGRAEAALSVWLS